MSLGPKRTSDPRASWKTRSSGIIKDRDRDSAFTNTSRLLLPSRGFALLKKDGKSSTDLSSARPSALNQVRQSKTPAGSADGENSTAEGFRRPRDAIMGSSTIFVGLTTR
ncbi:hypothetical protein Hypma_003412 [Hypsizygus marmoreus]|uniref:Uncharacterized protein n=1 Tax=Hypsizygus marmoreus TaxID=39966 RepID=A0A369J264_HYPMA|nr:hypothetical protein Hypma_003412 [Hypsizygus marmoreus]